MNNTLNACMRGYEWEVIGSHSTRGEKVFFSASVNLDVSYHSHTQRISIPKSDRHT